MRKRGRPPTQDVLTPREWEVWRLLRDGLSNREIAERLGISLSGAKHHVSEIISKLGVSTREEAASWRPPSRRWGLALPLAPMLRHDGAVAGSAKLVMAGVLLLLAVVILVVALGLRGSKDGGDFTEAPATTAPAAASEAPAEGVVRNVGQAVAGELVRIEGGSYFIVDGEGEHEFSVDAATTLQRPGGYVMVTDHDMSRLRIGDSLFVAAEFTREPLKAAWITANGFIGRDGLVAEVGSDYLDVRLYEPGLYGEPATDATRFLLDPGVVLERLGGGGGRTPLDLSDLEAGQRVQLQGFIADDGTLVALCVYTGG